MYVDYGKFPSFWAGPNLQELLRFQKEAIRENETLDRNWGGFWWLKHKQGLNHDQGDLTPTKGDLTATKGT